MSKAKDDGKIYLLGRSGLVYEQNGMLACIDGEGLAGESCQYLVVADSIVRWDYPAPMPISKEEQASIIERLRRLFQQQGCEVIMENRGYDPDTAIAYHDRIAGSMLETFERLYRCAPQEINPPVVRKK